MRDKIVILLFSLLVLNFSSSLHGQDKYQNFIDNYIEKTPKAIDSLIAASNRLIAMGAEAGVESATYVAGYLFNKFSTSQIMGEESVAIYVAKNYFLNGKLQWQGEGGEELLKLYIQFNEHSLIGKKAPPLALESFWGETLHLDSIRAPYLLLYFFDNNCNACREGFLELNQILARYNHLNIEVYAVYSQYNSEGIEHFTNEFKEQISNSKVKWNFVYDSQQNSGFHKLYNVLVTPRIFLLDQSKTIIGRNLNNRMLEKLLESQEQKISSMHTTAEDFAQSYLTLFNLQDTTEYRQAFAPLYNRVYASNPQMFNILFYHLFQYMVHSHEQHMKDCAVYVANNYILGMPHLWYDTVLTKQIIEPQVKRVINNREGSLFPHISFINKKGKEYNFNFKKSSYSYIYFFNPNCAICKPFTYELKKIFKSLKKKGVEVIAIYVEGAPNLVKEYIKAEDIPWTLLYTKEGSSPLHTIFETEYLPATYLINQNGVIEAKGINTIKLIELIE